MNPPFTNCVDKHPGIEPATLESAVGMHSQTRHFLRLRDLSRDLVRDFLVSDAFEVSLPKRIVLYGCPRQVLLLMRYVMRKELAGQESVSVSVRSHGTAASELTNDCYYIDVGYFLSPYSASEGGWAGDHRLQELTRSTLSYSTHRQKLARDHRSLPSPHCLSATRTQAG
jgi:hypothetical protein